MSSIFQSLLLIIASSTQPELARPIKYLKVENEILRGKRGFLLGKKFLFLDRDGKFAPEFQVVLKEAGIEPLLLPPQSQNLNAVRQINQGRMPRPDDLVRRAKLRETILSYVEHYHAERNHQGLDNKLIDPVDDIGKAEGEIEGEIECHERLGGMLKFYHRRTA